MIEDQLATYILISQSPPPGIYCHDMYVYCVYHYRNHGMRDCDIFTSEAKAEKYAAKRAKDLELPIIRR